MDMAERFRLVPKFFDGVLKIFIIYSNNEAVQIAAIKLLRDGQLNDDVELSNEVIKAMEKRIKKSI